MSVVIEVWEGEGSTTCASRFSIRKMFESGAMDRHEHKLIRKFKAKTWLEAMTKHHELMGWEPYKPPVLPNGEIDPVVLQPLDEM